MPKISNADLSQIFAERDSERVNLVCGRHQYVGNKMPPKSSGCKECWLAYYIYDIASTPPSLRKERLDELESVIRHTAEYAAKGKWDFVPDMNPTIDYHKDAADDQGNDKILTTDGQS